MSAVTASTELTDQEIQEWKNSTKGIPGMYFAGATAEEIRKGTYAAGKEIYGMEIRPWIFKEMSEGYFEKAMNMLVEKKMVRLEKRKNGRRVEKLYYVAEGNGDL